MRGFLFLCFLMAKLVSCQSSNQERISVLMDEEKRLSITNIHPFAGIAYTIKQQERAHD